MCLDLSKIGHTYLDHLFIVKLLLWYLCVDNFRIFLHYLYIFSTNFIYLGVQCLPWPRPTQHPSFEKQNLISTSTMKKQKPLATMTKTKEMVKEQNCSAQVNCAPGARVGDTLFVNMKKKMLPSIHRFHFSIKIDFNLWISIYCGADGWKKTMKLVSHGEAVMRLTVNSWRR